MCTRATFQFPANLPETPEITLLTSHDGYPAAAATSLRAMLQGSNLVDGNAFFRANPEATIVNGHEAYANTAYRYTLTRTMHVLVERRSGHGQQKWEHVYQGELLFFLNEQPGSWLHPLTLGRSQHPTYLTLPEMCQKLAQARWEVAQLEAGIELLNTVDLPEAKATVEHLKREVRGAARREIRQGRLGGQRP